MKKFFFSKNWPISKSFAQKSCKSDEKGQQTPKAILKGICLFCTYKQTLGNFSEQNFPFFRKTKDLYKLFWNLLLNYYLISCQALRTFSWHVTSVCGRKPPLTSFKIHIACGPSNRHFIRFNLNAKLNKKWPWCK